MIRSAPWRRQPATAPRPTMPAPKTTHVEPGSTLAVFIAAPRPVDRPHANRHARSSGASGATFASRSEEHTSELQSHVNLVCRLLLEKKKKKKRNVKDE